MEPTTIEEFRNLAIISESSGSKTKSRAVTYICSVCKIKGQFNFQCGPIGRKTPYLCHKHSMLKDRLARSARSGISEVKKRLIKRRGKHCEKCDSSGRVQLHHVLPIKDGGNNKSENCLLLCADCHKKEHNGRGTGPTG